MSAATVHMTAHQTFPPVAQSLRGQMDGRVVSRVPVENTRLRRLLRSMDWSIRGKKEIAGWESADISIAEARFLNKLGVKAPAASPSSSSTRSTQVAPAMTSSSGAESSPQAPLINALLKARADIEPWIDQHPEKAQNLLNLLAGKDVGVQVKLLTFLSKAHVDEDALIGKCMQEQNLNKFISLFENPKVKPAGFSDKGVALVYEAARLEVSNSGLHYDVAKNELRATDKDKYSKGLMKQLNADLRNIRKGKENDGSQDVKIFHTLSNILKISQMEEEGNKKAGLLNIMSKTRLLQDYRTAGLLREGTVDANKDAVNLVSTIQSLENMGVRVVFDSDALKIFLAVGSKFSESLLQEVLPEGFKRGAYANSALNAGLSGHLNTILMNLQTIQSLKEAGVKYDPATHQLSARDTTKYPPGLIKNLNEELSHAGSRTARCKILTHLSKAIELRKTDGGVSGQRAAKDKGFDVAWDGVSKDGDPTYKLRGKMKVDFNRHSEVEKRSTLRKCLEEDLQAGMDNIQKAGGHVPDSFKDDVGRQAYQISSGGKKLLSAKAPGSEVTKKKEHEGAVLKAIQEVYPEKNKNGDITKLVSATAFQGASTWAMGALSIGGTPPKVSASNVKVEGIKKDDKDLLQISVTWDLDANGLSIFVDQQAQKLQLSNTRFLGEFVITYDVTNLPEGGVTSQNIATLISGEPQCTFTLEDPSSSSVAA